MNNKEMMSQVMEDLQEMNKVFSEIIGSFENNATEQKEADASADFTTENADENEKSFRDLMEELLETMQAAVKYMAKKAKYIAKHTGIPVVIVSKVLATKHEYEEAHEFDAEDPVAFFDYMEEMTEFICKKSGACMKLVDEVLFMEARISILHAMLATDTEEDEEEK